MHGHCSNLSKHCNVLPTWLDLVVHPIFISDSFIEAHLIFIPLFWVLVVASELQIDIIGFS